MNIVTMPASIGLLLLLCALVGEAVLDWPSTCPKGCSCDAGRRSSMSQIIRKTVDCNGHGLHLLPANMSSGVEMLLFAANRLAEDSLADLEQLSNVAEIDLSSNHLYTLTGFSRPVPQVQYLTLMNNQLDYINNRTFWSMPNLEYISLANNKIEIMHTDALFDMRRLTTLDLSSNQIYTLDPKWFRDLSALRKLILSNNNLHMLRDSIFSFLRNLQHLDLSRNRVNNVYKGAFNGLVHLEHLDLHSNHLEKVPREAFVQLKSISLLDLGQNYMPRILSGDFENSSVAILKLNGMLRLRLVEARSFRNLYSLLRLEMAHNRRLQYVDPHAFHGMPNLNTLVLNQNNLSVLEEEVCGDLPSLSSLNLAENPLVCDCILNWLLRAPQKITLEDASSTFCYWPASQESALLSDPSLVDTPESCAPRLVGLFDRAYDPVLGDTLRLDCRAVGIPRPQTDWLLPSTSPADTVVKARSATLMADHREVEETGSLVIHYVQLSDHGDYTCMASNPKGRNERTASIRVKNMRANVIILHVTSTEVMLTWKSVLYGHNYQILYRAIETHNSTYQTVDIKPYMRTYTASQLHPSTTYEVCIAVKHSQLSIRINCTSILTKRDNEPRLGVLNVQRYVVGGVIGLLIVIVCSACGLTYAVKKYNNRKRAEEDTFSDNLSHLFLASLDSMSDLAPITFENRAAEIFDDDDLEEICATASMSTKGTKTSLQC